MALSTKQLRMLEDLEKADSELATFLSLLEVRRATAAQAAAVNPSSLGPCETGESLLRLLGT